MEKSRSGKLIDDQNQKNQNQINERPLKFGKLIIFWAVQYIKKVKLNYGCHYSNTIMNVEILIIFKLTVENAIQNCFRLNVIHSLVYAYFDHLTDIFCKDIPI